MKFTVAPEKLREGLSAIAAAVPSKPQLPVLANVLVEVDADGVRLTATDLDLVLVTRVQADVKEAGALTIPAKRLADLVKNVTAPITLAAKGTGVRLKAQALDVELPALPPEEFPVLPKIDFARGTSVAGQTLQTLIYHTAFAAAGDEARPTLNGVLWQSVGSIARMVATDGHRLAKYELPVDAIGGVARDLIVPPKALGAVQKLMAGDEPVQVAVSVDNGNHLGFQQGDLLVITRLIEGPYPNYEQVIPKRHTATAVADKARLESLLRTLAVLASDQTHKVTVSLNGKAVFKVQTPDVGVGKDEMPVQYTGEPMEVAFNTSYMLEMLRYIPTEEVELQFEAPERAILIRARRDGKAHAAGCMLLMPLRVVS